ncbi:SHOCT domain-containing protein [Actinomycetospora lemnae]|uniref:SHOCT domain-containing protein n=1 Tax=Actinomycetospora lemnae TaxID=3019891 RepID=A0ABT5SZM7_9PSEU|nr:SHOCT domain-containing protein [Actinomycetospora sp. DW7H6]MDD7968320.1 SHOCT domain-containing protein [Actinomycetospora sp. DW7H6]
MPGLLRGLARTALVAGTATAVSNRVSRRQAGRWAAQEAASAPPPSYPPPSYPPPYEPQPSSAPPPPPPPAGGGGDTISQLKELAELRSQGVLTDAEFEEQKRRILG